MVECRGILQLTNLINALIVKNVADVPRSF